MATASPIRDAFHQQGTGQALHTRCRPFSGTARAITTLLHPLRIHRAGLGPAHRSQPRPRTASWTQRRLPTSATIFTEHGHTKRPTIPRTKLAISALFAAPAGPRLRAARHREALLKPPGWHPKMPAAPAGKLRDSFCARWRQRPTRMLAEHLLSPTGRARDLIAFPHFEPADRGLVPTFRANGLGLPQAEVPETARSRGRGANSHLAAAPGSAPKERTRARSRLLSPPSPKGLQRTLRRAAAAADLPFGPAGHQPEKCRAAAP